MRSVLVGIVIGIALASAGVMAQQAPATPPPCVAAGNVQFICDQRAPEDLVVVPGGRWVVAGAYSGAGGINLIRVSDRTSIRAYPAAGVAETLDAKTYKSCPGVPDAATKAKFQTHGLSLREGRNGVHTLYVVLHGGRESVEVFTLDARPQTPTLTWIGCAVAPEPIGLNSIRWLDDGGFIATNFNPRGANFAAMQKGEKNGELWEWHTASGWQKVPGSESSGANGIEISPDGRMLYVAAWGSQSFFRLSRGDKEPKRDEIPLGFRVDNIRWAADGTLLAVGQAIAQDQPPSTVIVKIDPKTMKSTEILRQAPVGGFGAGTVAVEVGNTLWVGSYTGDRLAIFPAR
jgi:DNA-binding beta-propeller fold protein YncE